MAMTLARKMVWMTMAQIAILLLLVVAAIWGVAAMGRDVHRATDGLADQSKDLDATLIQYEKLRDIHALARESAFIRTQLLAPPVNEQMALKRARELADKLDIFLFTYDGPFVPEHRESIPPRTPGEIVAYNLHSAISHTERPPPTTQSASSAPQPAPVEASLLIAALDGLNSHLADRASDVQVVVQSLATQSQERKAGAAAIEADARKHYRNNVALVLSIAVAIIACAMVVAVLQYRGVMRPLQRLRRGVHSLTRGRFGERLPAAGEREFAELAHDFNQMAEELETLYRELEQEVAIKSKELVRSERLASVGFLAAGVAHEINNPLGIITGYAELSLRKLHKTAGNPAGDSAAETRHALQVILDEGFRCKRIIEKLLSLAKGGPTGDSTPRQSVSVPAAAEEVASMITMLGRFRGRVLTVDYDRARPLEALTNEVELKQILLNLTVNAMEAVDAQKGLVRMKIYRVEGEAVPVGHLRSSEGADRRDWIGIDVVDNGRGISATTLEHVFEPFFTDWSNTPHHKSSATMPATPTTSGVGLGLSIVHAIVTSHGGRITAHSDGLGHGAKFTVLLPAI